MHSCELLQMFPIDVVEKYYFRSAMLLNGNNNSSNGGTLLMKSDHRMALPTLPPATDYSLECRQLSYIRSFTAGRW